MCGGTDSSPDGEVESPGVLCGGTSFQGRLPRSTIPGSGWIAEVASKDMQVLNCRFQVLDFTDQAEQGHVFVSTPF